jgi:hypothetical protein
VESKIHIPHYGEKKAMTLLYQLLTENIKDKRTIFDEIVLLDMLLTWNVISPFRILKECQRYQLWKERFQLSLVHVDVCRHMYLYTHLQSLKIQSKSLASSSSLLSCTVDLLSLVSTPAAHCLRHLCQEPSSARGNVMLSAKEMITGRTSDDVFNNIQLSLRSTGQLPERAEAHYWFLMFLRYVHMDVSSLLRIVLLEIVRNCVHLSEYSSWPVSFLLSAIEDVYLLIATAQRERSAERKEAIGELLEFVSLKLRNSIA